MNVSILATARLELADAIEYYELESEGLGRRFSAEVRKTIERINAHPQAWTALSRRTRRCLIRGFPYGIIYQIRGETILIICVMHLHRNPETWKRRLPPEER